MKPRTPPRVYKHEVTFGILQRIDAGAFIILDLKETRAFQGWLRVRPSLIPNHKLRSVRQPDDSFHLSLERK